LITELKIQVDVKGSDGRTALHEAASKGYDMMIYVLLEAGAQVNALDNKGDTPLHCAVKN
jgi:ankyrin repeat protein